MVLLREDSTFVKSSVSVCSVASNLQRILIVDADMHRTECPVAGVAIVCQMCVCVCLWCQCGFADGRQYLTVFSSSVLTMSVQWHLA